MSAISAPGDTDTSKAGTFLRNVDDDVVDVVEALVTFLTDFLLLSSWLLSDRSESTEGWTSPARDESTAN